MGVEVDPQNHRFCNLQIAFQRIHKKKVHFSADFSHFALVSSHIYMGQHCKRGVQTKKLPHSRGAWELYHKPKKVKFGITCGDPKP